MPSGRHSRNENKSTLKLIDSAIAEESKALRGGNLSGAAELIRLLKLRKEYAPLKPVEVVWIDSPPPRTNDQNSAP